MREQEEPRLIKIFQYDFKDTATFGGSIFDPDTLITQDMEDYAQMVLLLFIPFRTLDDLTLNGSFTKKLQEVFKNGDLNESATAFLQNIQDAKSNCFQSKKREDDLERATDRFMPADDAFDQQENDDDGDDPCDGGISGAELEDLLKLLNEELPNVQNQSRQPNQNNIPDSFDLSSIRQKGTHAGGYEHIANLNDDNNAHISAVEVGMDSYTEAIHDEEESNTNSTNTIPTKKDLVAILLTKTARRVRSFPGMSTQEKEIKVMEANGSVKSIIDWAKKAKLDRGQRRAFEIFVGTFVLSFFRDATIKGEGQQNRSRFLKEKKRLETLVERKKRHSDQLICLLHGPGGSGKTTVIDLVMEYAREYCSFMENYKFTSRTIVVTAMTGVAATLLLGETTHSAVYLNQKRRMEPEQVEAWEDTRLLIIDEISFASKEDFAKLHCQLRKLKDRIHKPYGGLDIIFAGDMRQLEPVGKLLAVYKENCPEFKDWVNCYIELGGLHRFKEDQNWGKLLLHFRDGKVTPQDIDEINQRVVTQETDLPDDIRYATYSNRDRDAINTAIFEEHCERMYKQHGHTNDAVLVFSDHLEVKNSSEKYIPFPNCKTFWETCGEDNIKPPKGKGRMDPVLKFVVNSRVMLTTNSNVREGRANGTQGTFEKLVLKPGTEIKTVVLSNGVPVKAVFASNVEQIILKHSNKRIHPEIFALEPKTYTFQAKILKPSVLQTKGDEREAISMKAKQLPVITNNATTGHKLQGSGVDNVFIHTWSYTTNWVYVMLSRVRTKSGLYMRKPLSRDLKKYAVPPALVRMIDRFRKHAPTYWSDEEYEELFG